MVTVPVCERCMELLRFGGLGHTLSIHSNDDDIILAPGEVDWLREVFGSRAKIWPTGGHCGNMEHYDFVAYMVDYFKQ